jgi:hypothetical protein
MAPHSLRLDCLAPWMLTLLTCQTDTNDGRRCGPAWRHQRRRSSARGAHAEALGGR